MYRIGCFRQMWSVRVRTLGLTAGIRNNDGAVPGDLDYRRPRGKIWNDEAEIPEYKVEWDKRDKMKQGDAATIHREGKWQAALGDKPTDEWAPPEHPADVKREYVIEDKFQLNKWQDTFHKHRIYIPDEERYVSFPLVIGYVNRRIASDRVEVRVEDARFNELESHFVPDKGIVYVRDYGQTRIGEFIQAVLRDSEDQIASHDYDKTIKMPGSMTCPVTGKLVRNNRLVDDTPKTLEDNRALIDNKLDRRLYGYKYRDDFNRDIQTYELKWSTKDLKRAVEEGHTIDKQNNETFKNMRLAKLKKFKLSE